MKKLKLVPLAQLDPSQFLADQASKLIKILPPVFVDGTVAVLTEKSNTLVWSRPNTAPVLTLIGEATMQIDAGAAYVDAGYTVADAENNALEVTVTSDVDTSVAGVYHVQYSVSDTGGLSTVAIRTVTVVGVANTPPVITLNGNANETVPLGGIPATYEAGLYRITNVYGNFFRGFKFVKPDGSYVTTSVDSEPAGNYTFNNILNKDIFVYWNGTAPTNPNNGVFELYEDASNFLLETSGSSAVNVKLERSTDGGTTWVEVITTGLYNNNGITILGHDNVVDIQLPNIGYVDQGATATDAEDGVLPVTTTGIVDVTTAGKYTITYSATDNGTPQLTTTATRTVTVEPPYIYVLVENGVEVGQEYSTAEALAVSQGGDYLTNTSTVGTLPTVADVMSSATTPPSLVKTISYNRRLSN